MWYACLTTFWRQSTHLEGAWKERRKLSVFKFQSESFNIGALTTHVKSQIPVSGLYLPYLIFHWIWSVHLGQQLTTWVFWVARKQWLSKATCVFFITAILPSLWYLSVFHATVFCKIQLSKKCFFRFTAYKTSKIFLTWCFCPGLVTLLAAVGRVFPWRFFAPQAALQEKRSSIFGVMKFRNSVNRAFINYGRHLIDGGWRVTKCKQKRKNQNVLAAHSQLFCSLLSPSWFPVPLRFFFWNSTCREVESQQLDIMTDLTVLVVMHN